MKRRSYWFYKRIVVHLKNYFFHRSLTFYLFLFLIVILNMGLLYGCWWVGDLAYDSEMESLLSKEVLTLLIYTPISFLFIMIVLVFRVVLDRFQRKRGTRLRFRLVSLFLLITVIPSLLYVYVLDYILNATMDLYFKDQTIEAYKLSMDNLEKRVDSIKLEAKAFIDKNSTNFYNDYVIENKISSEMEMAFNYSQLEMIGVVVSNNLVYHVSRDKLSRNLIKRFFNLAKRGKLNTDQANYDLKNNYVLVSKTLDSKHPISVMGVVIPHYLLPKEIESTMSTVTRITQIRLLSLPIKNMLLFLYLYFYFPILSLGILIFYLRSKNISAPISHLNEAVKSISRDDFNFRVEVKGDDELADLVKSFKYMTKEILYNREKIRRMSQMEAWRDVAARLAHELKNPLTPIKLANDRVGKKLMKYDFDLYSELLPSFNLVNREIKTISELIKQFSQYSKDSDIHKVQTNMYEFAETLKDYLEHYDGVQKVFVNSLPKDIRCFIDERSIRQVVNNLVVNAVEALKGEEDDRVGIKVSLNEVSSSEWVEISVFDNGLGMSEDSKKKIFEPYFTTKESGTGLGLSICEKIISRHHGRLTFQRKDGQTVFLIQIPISIS